MHSTTAKLITLERAEGLVAYGWPKGAQTSLSEQARTLRHTIPQHILAMYDRLRAEHKDVVVSVFEGKCGGCQAPFSKAALTRLSEERGVICCEHCGRFLYLAAGHDLAPHHPHSVAGSHDSG